MRVKLHPPPSRNLLGIEVEGLEAGAPLGPSLMRGGKVEEGQGGQGYLQAIHGADPVAVED
jgi:6-phosphogluconate dehydrogenase